MRWFIAQTSRGKMAGYSSDPSDYLGGIVGAPITLTSGFRTPQRNALVGGVPNSAHLSGQAYDFVPKGISTKDAAARLAKSGIPFDQIEDGGDHVHISFAPTNRRQVIGPKMAQTNFSVDDAMAALSGGKQAATSGDQYPAGDSRNSPAAMTVSPPAQKNFSHDEALAALGGNSETGGPTPAVSGGKPQQAAASGKTPAGEFGFTQEMASHIPFSRDVGAGTLAGLDTLFGYNDKGGSFGDRYKGYLKDSAAAQQAYEAQNPGLSTLASGLGILGSGGPVRGAVGSLVQAGKGIFPKLAEVAGPVAQSQTLRQLMASGAKGGAALGTLFGAGEAGDGSGGFDSRAGNAALGAATGLGAGVGLPVLGAGVAAGGRALGGLVNRLIPDAATQAANRAKGIIETFAGGPVHPNAAELVPGSKPNLAESTRNTGVAALTRALRDLNPNSPLVAREAENAAARGAHFEGAAGTPEEVKAALAERDKAATAQLKTVFQPNQAPADTAPVTDAINDILAGSSGARPAVKQAMGDVQKILENDGKPVTNPKALYDSVRKGIDDLISGKDLTKGYGKQAARELIAVRDHLDEVIETSAPGFKQYLEDYAKASTPANSMEFLQSLNLTDAKGNITLAKVQNAIKRLQAQQAAPGIKGGKAVTSAQQQALESIRDDLLRADTINQGKSIGSNTVQNALAQKRLGFAQRILPEGLGATAGAGIGHLVAGPYGAEVGGFIGDRIGAAVGASRMSRNQQSQNLLQSTLEDMLLNPARYQNPHSGIPSAVRPLNEILNSPKMRGAMAAGNRLAISHQTRPKEKSR